MKRAVAFFLSALLILSGCGRNVTLLRDGVAFEIYTITKQDENYDYYHVQNGNIVKKEGYRTCYHGGVPKSARNRVGSYFGTDGHGMYKQGYGQMDDYYIDENIELYLYNKNRVPVVYYFKNGVQQDLNVTIGECRQLQVMGKYLYLKGLGQTEGDYYKITVEKIDLETNTSEMLYYQRPRLDSSMSYGDLATNHINRDESLFYRCRGLSNETDLWERVFLAFPDGSWKDIMSSTPQSSIELVFETEEGYCLLESMSYPYYESPESFFLLLRYFDFEGNPLREESLDCSEIIDKSSRLLNLDFGAAYHEGVLYLALTDYKNLYFFRYDLAGHTVEYDGKIKAFTSVKCRLVSIRNGVPYTLYGNGVF